jgi:MFS family permease
MPSLRRRDYPGWRMVWALAATTTVNFGVLLYAFGVFLPVMHTELDLSLGALSGAVSLAIAVAGVLAPVAGSWLDHHGARGLMTAGSLVAMVSVAGWSQVHNLWQLYLVFVGIGVASAAVLYDAAFAVVNTWFRRRRNDALLTVTVVAGFASTIFLPTTQALIDGIGWRQALAVLAALCGLTAIPHWVVLRRHPADHGFAPDGAPVAATDPVAEGSPVPEVEHAHGWLRLTDPVLKQALRLPSVRWLTVSTVAVTTGVTVIIVFLVSYLRSRGYPPGQAALGAGAIGVLSVTGRLALTRLARRLRLARVAAVMVAGQVAGLVVLETVPRPWGLVLFVLAFGAGFGVMTIARAALLSDYVPPQVFARVSGVQALVVDAGRIIAPAGAGALISATGGYGAMLAAVMACSGAAALALLVADRHHEAP